MAIETSTNLYGVTVNPCNNRLTAGGSSGGEGTLRALHANSLGIGSDWGQYIPKDPSQLPVHHPIETPTI